jgi:hypothetical protein
LPLPPDWTLETLSLLSRSDVDEGVRTAAAGDGVGVGTP